MDDGGGAYLYVALGSGVLVVLGVGLLEVADEELDELPDLPNACPSVFHRCSLPSHRWRRSGTWRQDEALLLKDLLTTLGAHRVLVVARLTCAHVLAAPFMRAGHPPRTPRRTHRPARPGWRRAVTALWQLSDAQWATMQAFADLLPAGVGGVLLTTETPSAEQLPFPVVVFTARDGGWTAECQGASLVVVRAPDGRLVSRPGEPVA